MIVVISGRTLILDDADTYLIVPGVSIAKNKSTFYASTKEGLLHRLITQAPPGTVVDHISRNGLDNRRSNLQVCGESLNRQRSPATQGISSVFRGVSFRKGKWTSKIWLNNSCIWLGTFVAEREAAEAYDKAALAMFGPTAFTNF